MLIKEKLYNLRYPIIIFAVIFAAIIGVLLFVDSDVVNSEEILRKEDWKPEQLSNTLGKFFTPNSNRDHRGEVLKHLRKHIAKLPQNEQQKVINDAITIAITENINQFRALPESDRGHIIDNMTEKAQKNLDDVRDMNNKDRNKASNRVHSDMSKNINSHVNKVIMNVLNPDERTRFAPITKIWVETIQELE